MNRLSHDDFGAFFRDIHGQDPFPWQQRLTTQVLTDGTWPRVIDLPTGTGKTAVLDTAVFTMAARPDVSPRRIVFVIDRRIVVDQVVERAQQIRRRVQAGETGILRSVRDCLAEMSGGESLGVAALRGGIPIDREWSDRPDQPWVVVSTVDQFGSRLLFRGYGITQRMRPINAGLAGNDCLVILDEVHLSVPFAETLAQVASFESPRLPRRFTIVEMSATPSNAGVTRFTLGPSADLDGCDELRRRVEARKEAELVSVRSHDNIPAAVSRIVRNIVKARADGSGRRGTANRSNMAHSSIDSVGIVVNRVRTARETHRTLKDAGYNVWLITGRMRPLDRLETLEAIAPAIDPAREDHRDDLTIVVATQAIEVGADFNFNALITECAAVDSLRQRFGRLDRRGTLFSRTGVAAAAWIIGPKSSVDSRRPDPIYGESIKVTWQEFESRNRDGSIQVGPLSLRDFPQGASAPTSESPLLLKTHMDAWVQTRPEPIVQPSVDWFLHGIEQNHAPDVSVVWRLDRSNQALRLVPPRQAEFLQVPIDAAKAWLSGGSEVDVADVTQELVSGPRGGAPTQRESGCLRWNGFDRGVEPVNVNEIEPGDVLIVDPSRGGLSNGTWDPSSNDVIQDLGDAAQIEHGRKATLRLDPRLLGSTPPALPGDEAETGLPTMDRVEEWLSQQTKNSECQRDWLAKVARRLSESGFEIHPITPDEDGPVAEYYILSERDRNTGRPMVDTTTMDGSDESGSLIGTGVTLNRHMEGVGDRARLMAMRLGLPDRMAEDLRLAGRLHDLGKVDTRFQLQLVGGDPVEMEMLDEPLGKSLPGARSFRAMPGGMRHEMASVALVESNSAVLNLANDSDLVLHLIGSHHGWGRPLPPVIEDPEPRTLSYMFESYTMEAQSDLSDGSMALEVADRFWRLVERYGYYGLAWLEAILQLADHRQSEEEARQS